MPGEPPGLPDHRRRPRLDRRDARARARALSAGDADRAGEQGSRGRLQPRDAGGGGRGLLPADQLGRLGRRRRGRADGALRRRQPARRGRRAAAAQSRRVAPALGSRLPHPLAAVHRVPLPAQDRAPLAGVQRVLRRRLRARPRARSGVHHGGVLPRPPRGDRGSRPLRRAVLHVQRGGGLVLALPPGGLGGRLLPGGRGGACRRRELEEGVRPDVPRAGPRAPPLPRRPQGDERGGARAAALPRRASACAAGSSHRAGARPIATPPRGCRRPR